MAVYFIRAGQDGPVKIGSAINVKARLSVLQTGNPEDLRLLRKIDGGRATELWLHAHFRALHVSREWFRYDSEMLAIKPMPEDELERAAAVLPIDDISERLRAALLARVEKFLADHGMAETTFGLRAVNDGHFMTRLRGKNVTLRNLERSEQFMRAHGGGP